MRDINEMAFDRVKWRQIAKQTCILQDQDDGDAKDAV